MEQWPHFPFKKPLTAKIMTDPNDTVDINHGIGLTKREYFAAMAMQGLLSADSINYEAIIGDAVKLADALIEELNKGK
jgi:hypothetical protein